MSFSTLASLQPKLSYLRQRAEIVHLIRDFFRLRSFLELETPIGIAAPAPEAYIDLYSTGEFYLASSPELEMKQLIAAGCGNCFQLTRSFRKEEHGRLHNREFSILEWYRIGASYRDLMRDCEDLVAHISTVLHPTGRYAAALLQPRPWPCITVDAAFQKHAGWSPLNDFDEDRFFMDLVTRVEPGLGDGPVLFSDFPIQLASLAQQHKEEPRAAERFELYIGGVEIANGFTELADAEVQRQRFLDEQKKQLALGKSRTPLPEAFLAALPFLPPSAGIALGVDRLVMLFTGATSVHHVMVS